MTESAAQAHERRVMQAVSDPLDPVWQRGRTKGCDEMLDLAREVLAPEQADVLLHSAREQGLIL